MRIQEIPDENICKNCQGLRKALNPLTKNMEPCPTCEGDGSISGRVGHNTGVINLYDQESKNPPIDDK